MKSVLDKLGYRARSGALAWRVPEELADQFAGLCEAEDPVFRLAFVRDKAEVAEAVKEVASAYRAGGHLWFAYPKKSGSIRSDLSRDCGWEPIAELGLLAVTQIAIDQNWSAIRFRLREEIKILRRRSEQG